MKAAWTITVFAILIYTFQIAKASENTCSSICNSIGTSANNTGKSCADIYQANEASRGVSGDYWIETSTGVHQVYCDMELDCGGEKGGWMRIADLDTSRGDDCPTGWSNYTTPNDDPTYPSIDVCKTPPEVDKGSGCYPATFSAYGAKYTKICGKARGYQKATTDAFALHSSTKSIDGPYVDGLSITLGNPRKHVWTYAAGISDDVELEKWTCPCATFPGAPAHSFIGNDYYCESGTTGAQQYISYTNDPLWDGDGCVGDNNNCCTNPSMPWFFRQFATSQNEDIEARICRDEKFSNEATLIDQLQLYIM